jgi:hypothetical protein
MLIVRTSAVAALLGRQSKRLYQLIEYGKIPCPPRDTSGAYYWRSEDIEAARAYLDAGRPYKPRKRKERA